MHHHQTTEPQREPRLGGRADPVFLHWSAGHLPTHLFTEHQPNARPCATLVITHSFILPSHPLRVDGSTYFSRLSSW